MVTVGILAAILNVFVLFVVAVADRAIELIVRGFAISRLKCTRRAPVIHDSDTWLPNIPRSFYKYHRNPGKLQVTVHLHRLHFYTNKMLLVLTAQLRLSSVFAF